MKKIETVTEVSTNKKTSDIICNMCGESCMVDLYGTDSKDFYGTSINIEGGYYSKHIGDGIGYKFDICEKCVANIIKNLKIPALKTIDGYPEE